MQDVPVHNWKRIHFSSPRHLERLLSEFPLDNEFIDWAADHGYSIVYRRDWDSGRGSVNGYPGEIHLGVKGPDRLVELALAHELVHISVPDSRLDGAGYWRIFFNKEWSQYEEIIDQFAGTYAHDPSFIEYAKKRLPSRFS